MVLFSFLCFQLEIMKQVCEDIAMIDFPVVALVLAGSCSYSVSSLVPFPGTLEPFCYGVPELITGRNQAMSHAQ